MQQTSSRKSRRTGAGRLLLVVLIAALLTVSLPLSCAAEQDMTLSVALYPYVPDQARFQQAVEAEWAARHPDVALRFVPWNAYTEDPPEDLDVFVYDSVFLYDFLEGGYLMPLADEDIREAGDLIPYALDACRVDGVVYAIPQLLCTNLLYAREGNAALSAVENVYELYGVVGGELADGSPRPARGFW